MQSEEFELLCQESTGVFDLPTAIEIAVNLENVHAQVSESCEPTEAIEPEETTLNNRPRTETKIDESLIKESSPVKMIKELKDSEQINKPQFQVNKSAVQTKKSLINSITNRELSEHDRDRVPKKKERPGSHRIQSVEDESSILKEPEEAEQPVQLGPVRHVQVQHEQQVDRKAKKTVSWSRKRKKGQEQRRLLQQSRTNMASV
jgi:hypothetical protein